jgi:hypothetical protein
METSHRTAKSTVPRESIGKVTMAVSAPVTCSGTATLSVPTQETRDTGTEPGEFSGIGTVPKDRRGNGTVSRERGGKCIVPRVQTVTGTVHRERSGTEIFLI